MFGSIPKVPILALSTITNQKFTTMKNYQLLKHTCETLIDSDGIELNVGYDYEITPSQIEEGHGFHEVGNLVYTELTSVEVVISGTGIDILPQLNDKQKNHIISLLNYDKC